MSAALDTSADLRERALAAGHAAILRACLDDPGAAGPSATAFFDCRPRYAQVTTWEKLPGFTRTVEGSTLARVHDPERTYRHTLLPEWEYAPGELEEMIQDLENLAAGLGQPTVPTRGKGKPRGPAKQAVLPL